MCVGGGDDLTHQHHGNRDVSQLLSDDPAVQSAWKPLSVKRAHHPPVEYDELLAHPATSKSVKKCKKRKSSSGAAPKKELQMTIHEEQAEPLFHTPTTNEEAVREQLGKAIGVSIPPNQPIHVTINNYTNNYNTFTNPPN